MATNQKAPRKKAPPQRAWIIDNDPVWLSAFMLCVGGTKRQAYERYCGRIQETPNTDGSEFETAANFASVLYHRRHKNFVLWIRDDHSQPDATAISNLCHEATHAALHIMEHCGIAITDSSDEALAYYVGYVVREVHKRLWPVKPRTR